MQLSSEVCGPAAALPAPPRRALDLALGLALGDRLTLLELPLAPSQAELDLRKAVHEIHAHRHEREPLLIHLAREVRDLAVVQQQLPRPKWQVSPLVPLLVGGNVDAPQPCPAAGDPRQPTRRARPAPPQAPHPAPAATQARFR